MEKHFSYLKTDLKRILEEVFSSLADSLNQALNRGLLDILFEFILGLLGHDWTRRIVREYKKHCNKLIYEYRTQSDMFFDIFCLSIKKNMLPKLRKEIKKQIKTFRRNILSFLNKLDQTAENLYYLASIDKRNQQRCLELFTTLKQEVVDDLSLLIKEVFPTTTSYIKT